MSGIEIHARRPIEALELPILVTGASGSLARLVLQQLLETHRVPPNQVIATTRRPAKLQALTQRGVIVREADFSKPGGLTTSFSGAKRALIISVGFDVPYVIGTRARMHRAAIAAAAEAGVPHILYMSAPNAEPGNPAFWHADHYESEQALLGSGAAWTILRVWDWPWAHYRLFWKPALDAGVYHSPTGSAGVSYIAKEDTAAAQAAALLSTISRNRRFDLTGPETLAVESVFGILETLTHKRVTVLDATPQEWERNHRPAGLSDAYMALWRAHVESQRGGWFGGVTNAVEELTGRKPMAMLEYFPRFVM